MTTDAVSCAISVLVTAILVLFSGPIFDFLTPDAAIAALGRQILRIELVLEIGRSINIVMVRCLVALEMSIFRCPRGCQHVGRLGAGRMVSRRSSWMGLVGVWWAMAADECLRAVVFLIRFMQGSWRKRVEKIVPRTEAHS